MSLRAWFERLISPGLGYCYRCRRPWKFPAQRRTGLDSWQQLDRDRFFGLVGVEEHSTKYSESRSCFPLCEGCWATLTPEERLPYYRQLWLNWDVGRTVDAENHEWAEISAAVLAGR